MRWSTAATCGEFTAATPRWYQSVQNNLFATIQEHEFFAGLSEILAVAARVFRDRTGAQLFGPGGTPRVEWNKKTYGSFSEKLYRMNCVENDNFPDPPVGGWVSLERSPSVVDDIVRTTIVVSYADAPAFLAEYLGDVARQKDLIVRIKDHAHEKGYYAYHLYVSPNIPLGSTSGGMQFEESPVPVELQITTVLQGALREVTHKLYEVERLHGGLLEGWKHQFDSGRFRAAYMAHTLRFIEAMIVDLRANMRAAHGDEK